MPELKAKKIEHAFPINENDRVVPNTFHMEKLGLRILDAQVVIILSASEG